MARMHTHHQTLTDGMGKCSKPMWSGGVPAGFCDAPAYGPQDSENPKTYYYEGGQRRTKYVPGLACPKHGGPPTKILFDKQAGEK